MQKGTSCLGQRTDDEGNRFGNVGSAEQGVPSWKYPPPSMIQSPKHRKCPMCAEEILIEAKRCKHCGEILDEEIAAQYVPPLTWNPGTAALISLFIPGGGHMYKNQIGVGLVYLILVPIGYLFFILPGLCLHIFCIVDSAKVHRPDIGKLRISSVHRN